MQRKRHEDVLRREHEVLAMCPVRATRTLHFATLTSCVSAALSPTPTTTHSLSATFAMASEYMQCANIEAHLTICRIKELVPAQSGEEGAQERVRLHSSTTDRRTAIAMLCEKMAFTGMTEEIVADRSLACSIKKPKTHRYPSLKGTDPKFRRNHRHALHGTMRALVCCMEMLRLTAQLTRQ